MTRQKVKLAMVANENSKTISLKKRRLGLVKKVRELTILCDVKACMIIYSPNDPEPLVWPSVDVARDLLDDFFSLPEVEKKKKETSLESYIKEKTRKLAEQLAKIRKKNKEFVVGRVMAQIRLGRAMKDLNTNEIYTLLAFTKEKILHFRKRLDYMEHAPLREPPKHPIEAQTEEVETPMNDVSTRGSGRGGTRARNNADQRVERINIDAIRESQSHYLMDQWFFSSPEPSNPQFHHQIGTETAYDSENPNPRSYLQCQESYLPYQGSNSSVNPNLEMEQIGTQVMTFHGLVGSMQHQNMNNAQTMAMSQQRQYPYEFMSREFGVKEEGNSFNNGDSQFHWWSSNNTMTMTENLHRQEPPPPPPANGATEEEGNADAASFDINRGLPRN
ncbi:unnamed protein product [Cochlearia groenlandica]